MESLENELRPYRVRLQVGVDVGQRSDPAAIVVNEIQRRGHQLEYDSSQKLYRPIGGTVHYVGRHVERLALGTSYPDVAQRVSTVVHRLSDYRHVGRRRILDLDVLVDATGVGTPVFELIEGHLRGQKSSVRAVYLTGGEKTTVSGQELRIPKAQLVSRLQVLLQNRRVHLPAASPHGAALVDELLNFELRITDNAHIQSGAFRVGQHDDLAIALGLACWEFNRGTLRVSYIKRRRP